MRNASRNSLPSSRIKALLAMCGILPAKEAGGGSKRARKWVMGTTLAVLLVGGVSLVGVTRRNSAKQEPKSVPAAATTDRRTPVQGSEAAAVTTKHKSEKKVTHKRKEIAKQEIPSAKSEAPGESGHLSTAMPLRQVVMSPPVGAEEKESDKEDSEISRKRQSWFFDQRAYPFKHIPAGAYQKALEQRDAMRARQRAAASSQLGANAVISFPGDALWHLMGPQPINETFSVNGGFPTASGRVTAIAIDPTNTAIVYMGAAAGGVWKTTDGGNTWAPLTDSQPSLAVGSIAIDPNSCSPGPCTTIYVGTGEDNFNGDGFYGAGILKSTNGGTTWTQLGATTFQGPFAPGVGGAQVGAISVLPGNSSVILAAVDFFDGNDPSGGIYRSKDGGLTWSQPTGATGAAGTGVVFESSGTNAWAALGDIFSPSATNNGIWKSTDSGATWTKQNTGANVLPTANVGRITLGYAQNTSGGSATVYAAIADSSTTSTNLLGFFSTTDGGASWTSLTNTPAFCNSQCFYDMAIGVNPANPSWLVIGGGAFNNNSSSVFRSLNGGANWTDITVGSTNVRPHVDTHALVWTPNGGSIYDGNDGGVWRTDDPKDTPLLWADLNAQLAITQFYPGPTAAVADENYGFGGTQDNDTELFSGSFTWQNEFICGDGGFTAIDQSTPTTIWAGCNVTARTKVRKAVFNGNFITGSFGTIAGFDTAETAITNSGDAMQFIPPLALDESNPDNLYFGTCRVWWAGNAASSLANTFIPLTPTWATISGDLTNGNATVSPNCNGSNGAITNLDVAHSNSGVVVAGTSNGKIWETTSAGQNFFPPTWTEIDSATLPPRTVTAARTKRGDATGAIVYATFSGFGSCTGCDGKGHVFKTTTAGSTNTWTDISGDLPDIPVNDIIVDHSSNPTHDSLYIATDVGVFACPDAEAATPCANWTVVGDGLPNSPVLGLAMRRSSRILRAATHGRSMWEIQLTDVNPPALAAINSVTPAAVNAGAGSTAITVTGLNLSTNTQVQFAGISGAANGVTTTFVNTTQLNVTLSSTLLAHGGVYPITLLDSQGVDSSSALGSGGLPFTVMNPTLNPATMTPGTAVAYTAVPLHLTATSSTEPFLPGTVLAFYDTSTPPVLKFTLPSPLEQPTISSGGTVYDLTTALTDLTTPATYQVVPYNPAPGGAIDPIALAAFDGGPVPFTFTVTANPGPVIQVNPNPIFLGPNAPTTTSSITTFQVTNLVGATLSISTATLGGANPGNFKFVAPTLAPSCGFEGTPQTIPPVAANTSCFFGLSYTAGNPPGNANSTATLIIADNASGSPQSIPITGVIATTASGLVFLSSANFGGVALGTTSPTMNATLSNFGSSPVTVNSAFSITGTNQADFHIVPFIASGDGNSACPAPSFTLPAAPAAGSSCDVTLTFSPSLPAGNEVGQLSVTLASGSVFTSNPNLTGTGIELTSISPEIVATGGPAFTLTVNGGGFAPSAVVNVAVPGGSPSPRLTTFVSSTELLASIPASDIATAGSLAISVITPVPGGTTSEPKTLFVAQAQSATNDNINFARMPIFGTGTIRTASGSFIGGTTAVTLAWSSPFSDTNYTALCTAETTSGDFLLPTITLRTTTSISVVPTNGGTPSGTVSCIALPDSDTSDIRRGRTVYSGAPPTVTVNWNAAFPDTTYVAVCTVETQGPNGGGFSSVISSLTTTNVVAINGGYATGTMHCLGVPATDTSSLHRGKAVISGSPATVALNWAVPFTNSSASINYAAVCSDVELGVAGSDAALAISAGSRTLTGITVINEIPSGTLHCLAIALGGGASVRQTEDTTQATAQTAGSTTPPATPTDPIPASPACAPANAAFNGRAKSVWWAYNAQQNGTVVADTRFSSYPTILSVWTLSTPLPSSTETYTPVACASGNVAAAGSSPVESLVTFGVTSGTTYYIMVSDATQAGAGGTLSLGLDFAENPPANDDFNNAIDASAAPFSNTVNSVAATADTGGRLDPAPSCAPAGAQNSGKDNSVWYKYAATANGTVTADTLTSPYETILTVVTGNPGAFTQVTCNASAQAGIAQSQVNFTVSSGTTYFIMVSSVLGDGGTTNFHLTFAPTSGPVATLTPSPVPFSNQRVNTTSSSVPVTLTNTGTSTLTLAASNAVTISGTNPSDFAIASGTTCTNGANVAASGGTCVINLTFKPGAAGARTATLSVADNANPSPQSVTLNGTGTAPIATVTPNPLAFGNQHKGTTSTPLAVTVKNTGTDTLNLAAANALVIGGANPGDFVNATGSTCANSTALAPNASCIVNITFTPSTAGSESATFTVTDDSNAVPGSTQVINLTGIGIFPQASATPNPLPFGNVPKNTTSAPMTVTLTNGGTDTLHLAASNAVVIGGANLSDFAVVPGTTTCTNGSAVASSGGTCVINITFTPSTTSPESATLTITDDASPTTQVVSLTGTGTAASVALSPSPVNYGNQRTNTTSAAATITLTNSGNQSVTLAASNAVTFGGTNPGDFATATGTTCTNGLVIAASPGPGNTCVIHVTFTPGALGLRTATLNVADNATPSPQSVTLNGTGTFPQATPTPSPLAFGNQRKGTTSATQTLTLTNGGTDTLHLAAASAVALSGASQADFAIVVAGTTCTNSATVAPNGGTCVVKLTFTPSTAAAESASITFTDDANPTTQVVSLTGTGTSPTAAVAPSNIPFGNQRTQTTSPGADVTVSNTGTDTLNIASIKLTGTDITQFALGAPSSGTACSLAAATAVGAGSNCKFSVKFAPTSTGAKSASVTVTDDSGTVVGSTQAVTLTGTGIFPQAAATPATLPFGNQPKGVQSAPQTITLTNAGTDTLHLGATSAVAIGGANLSDFAIVAGSTTCTNGSTVAPTGGTCVINITFTPSTTSPESATVTITDDANPTAQTVSLTGTGTTATVNMAPSPLQFPNQRKGTTSGTQTITLTNSGNSSVQLAASSAVTLGGANAPDFAITGGTCVNSFTVGANGGTCTITVTFTPSALGAEFATVTAAFQGATPSASDNLTGTGVFPQASPTPSPLNFGNQVVNTTSAALAITLSNPGTDTLHLAASSALTIAGTNLGDFAIASTGTTCANGTAVAPGASCVINVTFTPGALNARTATLTIADDASPATQTVALNGTGTNPAPSINTLTPNSATAGGATFTLTIAGSNFVAGATVNFGSTPALTPTTITAGQIQVTVPGADIATAGLVNVTVTNPAPGGGTSTPATFTVNNPAPTLASVLPASGLLNQAVTNLTLTGTNFVAGSIVNFGANADSGAAVSNSGTTLTITIPAAQVNAAGQVNVTVTNPAPGGGTTSAQTFTVNNPVPTIGSLSPISAVAGGAAFALTVNGTNFTTTSVVSFNGAPKTTTFVSSTQVTAAISAADIATAGTVNVSVTTPAPGGGTTANLPFMINNPAPTITSLSPSNSTVGGLSFVLTVNGTNFIANSVVNFNGGAKATVFKSNTQLTATILATDIANAGLVNVTVTNPSPGGGTSTAVQFTINNVQPTLTSLLPTSTLAGGPALTLTVNAQANSFVQGAVVSFNGSPRATIFVNSGQLTAAITAADIAKAGSFNVTVTNPPPSVGPSVALTFTVDNPAPTITGATAGGQTHVAAGTGFTLTVNGTNFVSASVVNFGTKAEPTTLVSPTQVTAAIPAGDVSTAGTVNVTVTNPAPGGGATPTSISFTVDGFTLAGPGAAVTVKAGQTASIPVTVTPSTNGFANQVTFNVTGLPPHATFTPVMATPGNTQSTVALMIATVAHGAVPPASPMNRPLPPLVQFLLVSWVTALLVGLYLARLIRRTPRLRRYAAVVPLALLLVTGVVLAGCASGMNGTPAGTSQLTITATSGSFSQTTQATLTVQ